MILMSLVHSGSLSRVPRKTTFARYELNENSTLQKVLETTHTSFFTMTFTFSVHAATLSLVRRTTSILRYE